MSGVFLNEIIPGEEENNSKKGENLSIVNTYALTFCGQKRRTLWKRNFPIH